LVYATLAGRIAAARWVRVTFDKTRSNDRNTGMFVDEIGAGWPG